ncbi:hypothetical protein MOX02_59010 [Methylobacterium oxalidis]|uniref:Uncharacterized protein n=1 Tax=Methylobacterium oxalidis TaxID=944322 RepID=A0A512JD29_9HYPH|nr:hypothetical protein MOX02_59010 [Methylobacterium oxalidis]
MKLIMDMPMTAIVMRLRIENHPNRLKCGSDADSVIGSCLGSARLANIMDSSHLPRDTTAPVG